MTKLLLSLTLVILLASCSNDPEMETGEIRTLQLLKQVFDEPNKAKLFIDARNLLSREQVDAAKTPVLFVELASGQNGTLTPYPGRGVGQTWLGADGAMITMEQGVLKASRGMGDDLMGSSSFVPVWSKVNDKTPAYSREFRYITGNNKISQRIFKCDIQKANKRGIIKIWELGFKVDSFEENCRNKNHSFRNTYYVDTQGIVRKSLQYHSDTIGYILIERLDR